MLHLAEHDDIPDITRMCLAFKAASPYAFLETSQDQVRQTILRLIEGDKNENVVVLAKEGNKTVGMVAGVAQPFLFSNERVAGELVWWVDPEHRKSTHGKELHAAFEFWAAKVGAAVVTMALLEDKRADKITKLYERKGYTLAERAFLKKV